MFKKTYYGVSYLLILGFFLTVALFYFFPTLDLSVSGFFYKEGDFYLKNSLFAFFFYYFVHFFMGGYGVFLLVGLIISAFKGAFLKITRKTYIFLFSSLMAGPLIINNVIVKSNIGRARPREVHEFGGEFSYSSPLDLSANYCNFNCSFVCGHRGAAFYMVIFAYLFVGKKREILFWAGILTGVMTSLVRIMQGGHFFSDAIFSFFFVFIPIKIIYYFMYQKEKL